MRSALTRDFARHYAEMVVVMIARPHEYSHARCETHDAATTARSHLAARMD